MLDKFSPYTYSGQDMFLYDSEFGGILTHEGSAAVQECIDALKDPELPPMDPLVYSDELGSAAQGMVDTQGPTGQIGHTGPDGSSMSDRILPEFGYEPNEMVYGKSWAENIAYRFYSANMSIVNLIVDDNVPNRGHRINLLNPDWHYVGIGQGTHASYDWMQVQNFAYGFDVAESEVCLGSSTVADDATTISDESSDEPEAESVGSEEETSTADDSTNTEGGSDNGLGEEHGPCNNPVPVLSEPPADWPEDAYYRYQNMGVTCESMSLCTLTTTYTYFFYPEDSGLKMIYEVKNNHTYAEIVAMFSTGFTQIEDESQYRY